MKKFIAFITVVFVILGCFTALEAKTINLKVTFTWDGLDSSGIAEGSFPVVAEVMDVDSGSVLSPTFSITTAPTTLTTYSVGPFAYTIPDNATKVIKLKARLTDGAGNVGAWSSSATYNAVGDDTNPPSTPNILQLILAWLKNLFHIG